MTHRHTTNTKQQNPCCTYDFTIPKTDKITHKTIITGLTNPCKKWCFQLEKGESGYEHYQGRFSLKHRARLNNVIDIMHRIFGPGIHLSTTSSENSRNFFYVTKEETRIDGPWSDDPIFQRKDLPLQLERINHWKPFQQSIVDMIDSHSKILEERDAEHLDTRTVHVLIQPIGGQGKTSLFDWLSFHDKACKIPYCNDTQDIMAIVIGKPTAQAYFIDMPKASNKEKLAQTYAALEMIKDGYAFDKRYKFKEKYFDSPLVFVSTNTPPDLSLLSPNRWKLWGINKDEHLVPWNELSNQSINHQQLLLKVIADKAPAMPPPPAPSVLTAMASSKMPSVILPPLIPKVPTVPPLIPKVSTVPKVPTPGRSYRPP